MGNRGVTLLNFCTLHLRDALHSQCHWMGRLWTQNNSANTSWFTANTKLGRIIICA